MTMQEHILSLNGLTLGSTKPAVAVMPDGQHIAFGAPASACYRMGCFPSYWSLDLLARYVRSTYPGATAAYFSYVSLH